MILSHTLEGVVIFWGACNAGQVQAQSTIPTLDNVIVQEV